MAQIVNKRNFVGISQLECKRKGCVVIDLVYSSSAPFISRGYIYRVPTDKGFPYATVL
jgi:hypothetical protein